MATMESVFKEVSAFASEQDIEGGLRPENAFVPWFLHKYFRLSPQDAMAQTSSFSSSVNNDGQIDGFHFETNKNPPVLWIIQGKLTKANNYQIVIQGVKDLIDSIDTLTNIVVTGDTGKAQENHVLKHLRLGLDGFNKDSLPPIKFVLLHSYDTDREVWGSNPKIKELEKEFVRRASSASLKADLEYFGPNKLDFPDVITPVPSTKPLKPIRFTGTSISAPNAKCWFGLGYLSDLVDLYDTYRTALFAKNVRMFLFTAARKEQGAVKKIEESLKFLCLGEAPTKDFSLSIDHFPMMHNGIVVKAENVEFSGGDGTVTLKPGTDAIYVLNGCQTIYTAWRLREKWRAESKLNKEWENRWSQIKIPLRILISNYDGLVRTVTINTNRQTEIDSSAFFAHEPSQLQIERIFRDIGIFYERQRGAYDHLSRADSRRIQEDFPNTGEDNPVNIVDLGQAIASADRTISIRYAVNPQKIFDSEEIYAKVFSDRKIDSAFFLTFLCNGITATRLALRNMSDSAGKANSLSTLKAGSLAIPTFRLLIHYLAEKTSSEDWEDFSVRTYSNNNEKGIQTLKDEFIRYIRQAGIPNLLKENWFDDEKGWRGYQENARVANALSRYKWGAVDVFAWWDKRNLSPK